MSEKRRRVKDLLLWGSVATLLCAQGCSEEVVKTSITIRRNSAESCTATLEGKAQPMNTYMLEVFSVVGEGSSDAGPPQTCAQCVVSRSCALLQQQCLRGAEVPTSASALAQALSGLSITELEGQTPYCVRVTSFQTSGAATGEGLEPVACDLDNWLLPPDVNPDNTSFRTCAISSRPLSLKDAESLVLDLWCLDDDELGAVDLSESEVVKCLGQSIPR